jgi:hypothetical protein
MSIEFEHLSSESREETHLPSEERVRRIQAERWIGYARAETILSRLDELLQYPQRDSNALLLLHIIDEDIRYSRAPTEAKNTA